MTKPASAPPAALLPCPFCGNPNVTDDEGCFPLNHARSRWEVRCGNPSCYAHEQEAGTHKDAVAKWNKRAASAQVREVEPLTMLDRFAERAKSFAGPAPEPVPVAQGIERFYPWIETTANGGIAAEMVKSDDGGYVAAADHARIVAELQARIERLSVEATNWYRAHTQAEASLAACRASEARLVSALKGAGYCGMVNGCHPSEGRHEDTCIEARAAIAAVLPLAGEV